MKLQMAFSVSWNCDSFVKKGPDPSNILLAVLVLIEGNRRVAFYGCVL